MSTLTVSKQPAAALSSVPQLPILNFPLSISSTLAPANVYEDFIHTYNSPSAMVKAYDMHRRTRNRDRKALLEANGEVTPDPILKGLVLDNQSPDFDPRNCVTVWCRPTRQVVQLVQQVQSMLRSVEPDIWLMPPGCLHMTALEILHSAADDAVTHELQRLKPYLDTLLAPRPAPVLVKPMLSFDQNALALSFLPEDSRVGDNGSWYTYHHYRRDLYNIVQKAGVPVESRYQVPSAHVTIARFVKPLASSMQQWLAKLDEVNNWLETDCGTDIRWAVGDERGSECRCGRIWYGGGYSEATGPSIQEADEMPGNAWREY
ncbi:RNA ligase/cyclic nucleotide phosphodiesterase [Lipomyces kononenkoae]|uniref:RNA ligase/cyclic nucleotide phosphodiesterase n=1 Tax=Lipomyces kononenkoae TaxID=34357 RepID=A0ACC3SSQ9_LIPKO